MYLASSPLLLRKLYSSLIWKLPGSEKRIYLTFDDGPIPQITPWVLDLLSEYNAKATFFCIGKNVERNTDIFKSILSQGHSIGNHTYTHLNGWRSSVTDYLNDINKCGELIDSNLFRPPYGKIKRSQIRHILPSHKIIMWDILSRDFDENLNLEKGFEYIKKHVKPGSIIVFHDSIKAWPRLQILLPRTLEYFRMLGYTFEKIEIKLLQK